MPVGAGPSGTGPPDIPEHPDGRQAAWPVGEARADEYGIEPGVVIHDLEDAVFEDTDFRARITRAGVTNLYGIADGTLSSR